MSLTTDVASPSTRSSLSRALIVTRRELRDTLRDWRIVTPIVTLVILLPFILASVLNGNREYLVKQLTEDTFYNKLLPFTMIAIGFLPMSFCLVIALETFVGEKERNSLEALLSAPLTDLELFMGKYIAATLPTLTASVSASFIFWVIMQLVGLPIPVSAGLALTFIGLNAFQALVMVAASVLVSTHTTSVRAANIMASFIILPMSLVVQLEAILLLTGLQSGMYFVLLALMVVLGLLLRSGVKIFNREEIVAREGDSVTLRGIFRGFGYYWKRTPREVLARQKTGAKFTLWRLYRHDIPQIVAINKGAFALIGICTVGAIGLALWISYWPEFKALDNPIVHLSGQKNPLCETGLSSKASFAGINATWGGLFTNNLTAVLIGSGLSLVSLGVVGILIVMASIGPFGLIAGLLMQQNINPLPLLLAFTIPHGIFELPAVIIGIAAGVRISNSIFSPPPGMGIGASLQFAMVNYVKVLALVVPLLLIAALIESQFTAPIGCWLTNSSY